jgi:hypothetical protein
MGVGPISSVLVPEAFVVEWTIPWISGSFEALIGVVLAPAKVPGDAASSTLSSPS